MMDIFKYLHKAMFTMSFMNSLSCYCGFVLGGNKKYEYESERDT